MPKVSDFPYLAPTPSTKIPVAGETHFLVGDIAPAKVYRALLTQISTLPPSVTVLENTLNGTVVWTYNAPGSYVGTLVGAFPPNKCFTQATHRNASATGFIAAKAPNNNSNDILVTTFNGSILANNLITDGACLEVLVYP